jgi:hypothetical protein
MHEQLKTEPPAPRMRQVAFSLSEEDFARLDAFAERKRLTVSALCRVIVCEELDRIERAEDSADAA